MEVSITKFIELEDCSKMTIKKRYETVRRALNRYKYKKLSPEERKILVEAMQKYKSLAIREEKARIYNVLLYYYFSSSPLTDKQLMKLFNIDRRTVYKDIDKGVKDLTVILYGIGGIELLPEEESPAFIKAKLQDAITKKLTEEFGRR
ncbi:MAG: hypothetical protein PWR06_572 [Thermoanaerobacteraceae bacterium]|nr:hypothetical protein [Thermoanaerobacteraceae bacterium]